MPSHSQIIKEIEDYIEELRWMKEDEVKVKPQTAGWKPPTEIPSNWRLIKAGIHGAAYQSRNGLKVMLSCCIEADEKTGFAFQLVAKTACRTGQNLHKSRRYFWVKKR